MAKYKAYPEYKDSGVESLDTIPKMWSIKKLKYIFEIKKRIAGKIGFDVLSVTQKGIKIKDIESGEGQLSMDYSKYQRVYPGEFAMNHMDLLTGYVDISNYDGVTSPDYRVFAVQDKHSFYSRYYLYLLQDGYKQRRFFHLGQGSAHLGRWRLPTEAFNEIVYPCPSLAEQIHIASFLDHETAKIDNLIEKQQQLIELLKEKRQAVISHAVTKGLNPDVPMKDSGIEWLGEVPAHWNIAQLKFNTIEMQTGPFGSQLHAEDYVVDGIPLINPAHMNAGIIIPDPKVTVDETTQERLRRHKLSEGEIIFSRRGELGRCAVVKKNNEGWLCGTGSMRAKLKKKIIPDYAYTLISSEGVVSELTLESKGSTMANLNTETLGRIRLPVPPSSEQEAILGYIKIISDKYDYLIRSAVTAIRFMEERRTALISAAVTGKIDVRDWVAPDTQKAEKPEETAV